MRSMKVNSMEEDQTLRLGLTASALVLMSLAVAPARAGGAEGGVAPQARTLYAQVLQRHVEDGRVDYAALKKQSLEDLDRYLEAVAQASLPEDRADRIGFWVDAYNALVLRSVIRHGKPRSVLDVEGFFSEPAHTVARRKVSLDTLEKKVLNPYARDPRTHFVLVCAAVSCPILEKRPYAGSDVSARMETASRRYLASGFGARVDGSTLRLSKIFDWYAEDFGGREGVLEFVRPRLPTKAEAQLPEAPDIAFLDYNWTLNQR